MVKLFNKILYSFNQLKNIFKIVINKKILKKPDFSEKKIFLSGKILEQNNLRKKKIKFLKEIEFSVFSQNGEDGILSWIIDKMQNIENVFVEIGTEDYWESNTRFLLKSRNWKGYLFEGSKESSQLIKRQKIYWQHNLKVVNTHLNRENINTELKKNISETNIGLLSIDVDGIDYWILKDLNIFKPKIIVCEYNTLFGDLHGITVPYDKNFNRSEKHSSNLYFGASIKAMIDLLKDKGYELLGTNSNGINAFFVRNDYSDIFHNIIEEKKYFSSNIREGRDKNYKLTFKNNLENFEEIKDLQIYDIKNDKIKFLREFEEIYSKEWLSESNYT